MRTASAADPVGPRWRLPLPVLGFVSLAAGAAGNALALAVFIVTAAVLSLRARAGTSAVHRQSA